ncbi:MAG: response regulator transcription factor [Chloracidobacterium sp.]|uniref:Response regulator transcription factor n=1 Tax=Chloracidobacterium validum TaxID=2821543 RepID=A0ABX8B753_9BACT|nr:response regulator transcription factor [Chloracidobacterium validum]QUW01881.1 response regulator transcription factor [Chloracidobacterium validum]
MPAPDAVVYVVDDDESVRQSLGNLLRSAGLAVELFPSAAAFLAKWRRDSPGCLVLDVRLPGTSGLDLQTQLTAARISLPIIFITGHGDIQMSVRAMKAGAIEFLTKPFRDEDLLAAIEQALARDREAHRQRAELAAWQARYASLTAREREVMALVVAGRLNKQIAAELGTSEITVKVHRGQVMRKMQVDSLPELVRLAERLGIGGDPSGAQTRLPEEGTPYR